MENQLIHINTTELQAIEPSKAEAIRNTFLPMAEMLAEFEGAYNALVKEASAGITLDVTSRAKRLRLDIAKVRIETGKLKDKQKEYIKLEDKAIMGVHNVLVWAVKEKEDKLKEIESHFEQMEKERLERLQKERAERLSEYVEDAHERDLSKFADDEFEALYQMKKKQYEDKLEAERLAELARKEAEQKEAVYRERLSLTRSLGEHFDYSKLTTDTSEEEFKDLYETAQIAKQERDKELEEIRLENLRLYNERKEAEAKAKAEAQKRKQEEAERAAQAQKECEELEAKIQAERKARLDAERKEQERLEAEARAKAEAERLEAERIQNELAKGDLEKVQDLKNELKALCKKYSFDSEKNKKMYAGVCALIAKIINYIG